MNRVLEKVEFNLIDCPLYDSWFFPRINILDYGTFRMYEFCNSSTDEIENIDGFSRKSSDLITVFRGLYLQSE